VNSSRTSVGRKQVMVLGPSRRMLHFPSARPVASLLMIHARNIVSVEHDSMVLGACSVQEDARGIRRAADGDFDGKTLRPAEGRTWSILRGWTVPSSASMGKSVLRVCGQNKCDLLLAYSSLLDERPARWEALAVDADDIRHEEVG
jgi:hypothetical protein